MNATQESQGNESIDIGVVVVSYRSLDLIRECIKGWSAATAGLNARLVVVENGTGESVETLVPLVPGLKVINLTASIGFSAAVNLALKELPARYLALLNPDTSLCPGLFTKIARFMDLNPDVAIAGPRVWDDDLRTSIQRSWRRFPSISSALFNRYSVLSRIWPRNPWTKQYLMLERDSSAIQYCDWVSGCCMIVRKDFFLSCGGMDPKYPLYCEDVDICRQAALRGLRVAYFPEVEIVHKIGGSSKKVPYRSLVFRHRSMQHYVLKYWKIWNPLAWLLVIGIWLRFIVVLLAVTTRGTTSKAPI